MEYKEIAERDKQVMHKEILELKNDLSNAKISENENVSKLNKEMAELMQVLVILIDHHRLSFPNLMD